jgi:hypothetical protein
MGGGIGSGTRGGSNASQKKDCQAALRWEAFGRPRGGEMIGSGASGGAPAAVKERREAVATEEAVEVVASSDGGVRLGVASEEGSADGWELSSRSCQMGIVSV